MPSSVETPPADHLERARALLSEGAPDLTMGEALARLGLGDRAGFRALEWVVREIYYADSPELVYAAPDGGEPETLDQVVARLRERFARVTSSRGGERTEPSAPEVAAVLMQDPPPRPPRRPNRSERRREQRRRKREERQRQRYQNRQRVRESRS